MVIRLPGLSREREILGPQPGPDPAWARFKRQQTAGGAHPAYTVSLQSFKPEITAYRVLGTERSRSDIREVAERTRNRHNTGVYITTLERQAARHTAGTSRLPVVGEIAAGQYDVTVAFQDYDCLEGGIAVDKALARGGAYALRVRGTSMTHVGIEPGDMVIVRPQSWADDGDFVVANYIDGEAAGAEGLATLKRFYKRKDHIFLQSATASTDPIRLFAGRREGDRDPVRIQGVVTMVVKSH